MLRLNNIVKIFNKGTVDENVLFNDFSFNVNKGDFISVIGSNGSGKTTLLNLACGTMQPDSGSVSFEGNDITKGREYKGAKFSGRVLEDPRRGFSGPEELCR